MSDLLASGARWEIPSADLTLVTQLAEKLRIHPVVATVLCLRGVRTQEEALSFLSPSLDQLHEPFLMKDMGKAVERLRSALDRKERILVHGDYDVDGVTATALLVRFLGAMGAEVGFHIPHRVQNGYGVSMEAVESAAAEGVKLVLTADCGVTAVEQVARAKELGVDAIVTDHHQPSGQLPPAFAVLNPQRRDCDYPFKDLAGVGVAFKLASALTEAIGHKQDHLQRAFLDLVALGTIADVAPLLGENRTLAKFGLEELARTRKPGLRALMEVAAVRPPLKGHHVGFALGPRLNAAGRLEHAQKSLELLLTRDPKEATTLANELDAVNRQRQEEEEHLLNHALGKVEQEVDLNRVRSIVLSSPKWHIGLVGIVASRLVDRFHRPALLLCEEGDVAKGSGRSIEQFHLFEALEECRDLLTRYGGHRLAAGLALEVSKVREFRQRFDEVAQRELTSEDLQPTVHADCLLSAEDITPALVAELRRLEPFGWGNPSPAFAMTGGTLLSKSVTQDGAHLRLRVRHGTKVFEAIAWRKGEIFGSLPEQARVDLCFSPEVREFGGYLNLQLVVREVRMSQ